MRRASEVSLLLFIVCAVPRIASESHSVQSRCPSRCVWREKCPAAVALLRDTSDEEAVERLGDAFCKKRYKMIWVCCEKLKQPRPVENEMAAGPIMESPCPSRCVLTRECPAAVALLRDTSNVEAVQQLRDAYCRHRGDDVEVCCEMLQEPRPVDVSKHRSVALLPESCGYSEVARIFGGQEAAIYEFPWMALISYNTKDGREFQCAGSLINSRYVLTAAHCVVGRRIAGVRLGDYDINSDEDCQGTQPPLVCEGHTQDKVVETVIVHPGYTQSPINRNDIALLRFKIPADTTWKNVRPICLPLTEQQISRNMSGANAVIAGWGATETGQSSPVLLKAHVPIQEQEACRRYWNKGRTEDETKNKLCAGKLDVDSCRGDSGGPLILSELDSRSVTKYTQYGIVSYGSEHCGSLFPGVYTDVRHYVNWILDNIQP